MAGINKVLLIGNLGKDPEIRNLEGGAKVANFSLATTEVYKDKAGNRQEQTEWHNLVLWRGLADVAEKYLKKGMMIYVEGKLRTRSWDDKEGNKRYTTEVVADNFTILNSRKTEGGENNAPASQQSTSQSSDSVKETDDLPF